MFIYTLLDYVYMNHMFFSVSLLIMYYEEEFFLN